MKSLLLGLFLYIALVWVGGAYLYTGSDIVQFGLKWTAIGLIVLLVLVVGTRIWHWWGLWRAKSAGRPAAPKKPSEPVHEDDAALQTLLAEASATLAKAPAFAAKRAPLSGLPLYLLIGPENSGKTSTFINAGLEAQLLAGRVTGTSPVVPTRLCNIWFAKDAIFIEIAGRSFSGDLGRWTQLLRGLRGSSSLPLWRRLWAEPEQGMALHGVIGFCEVTDFTGSSNPERLDQSARAWHERLQAIGEVFGSEFPVYQVISKCDTISFFSDYFKRLPETEANQVLGCTLPFRGAADSQPGTVFAEAEGKRLTKSFNPLYYALAGRRLTHLAHEPDPARRPQIYEFPREFKRIRSPLVEFLNGLSRPDPLPPRTLAARLLPDRSPRSGSGRRWSTQARAAPIGPPRILRRTPRKCSAATRPSSSAPATPAKRRSGGAADCPAAGCSSPISFIVLYLRTGRGGLSRRRSRGSTCIGWLRSGSLAGYVLCYVSHSCGLGRGIASF